MRLVAVLALSLVAAACGESAPTTTAETAPAPRPVQLAAENVTRARTGKISSGPTISGQLTPAH